MPFPSFPLGSRQHISARLRSLRRSAAGFIGAVVLAAAGAIPGRAELPPDVFSTEESIAPAYTIPHPLGGSSIYEGAWTLAGDHLVEMDPYNLATGSAEVSLAVRKASDHAPLYRLRPNIEITGVTDGEVFSDGKDLAFRTRPQPDATARVEVRDLATGALRFSLGQTDPRGNDDFGRAVWFTANRILVAAPGRDRYHRDAGALYVFDRATGRHVGNVGPGVKGARFGTAPDSAARGGPQPLDTPYVQVSGRRALIVHGRRAFVFSGDQLHPLVIPANGLNRIELRQAILTSDRVVLTTSEFYQGHTRPGRVLGYDLATRRLLYQIRASSLRGSYDFPSRIVVENGRLHVLDAAAGLGDTKRNGALYVFNAANGKRLRGVDFPYVLGVLHDSLSFSQANGRLWLRSYESASSSAPRTIWRAYDPATLELLLTLSPPGQDRFAGRTPQALPDGRLAVAASRVTSSFPWPVVIGPASAGELAASAALAQTSSLIIITPVDPFTTTTAGVLLYDPANATWTHRLVLEGDFYNYNSWDPQPYESLLVSPGTEPAEILVRQAGERFRRVVRYDPVLPDIAPLEALEGRLSANLQSGFSYDLFRRSAPEDAFAFDSDLGVSLSASLDKIVPYEDSFAAGAYRLDGLQISRRLSAPEGGAISVPSTSPGAFARFGDRLAIATYTDSISGGWVVRQARLQVVDLSTRETTLELSLGSITVDDIALNADTVAVNTSYGVKLYSLATGELLPWSASKEIVAARIALTGDRLVVTSLKSVRTRHPNLYVQEASVSVYSLSDGALLHTRIFAEKQVTPTGDTPPLDLAVTDDAIIVRGMASERIFPKTQSDDGRVLVLDLDTGDTRYELASPAPEPGDWFGAWIAAAGPWLAVGSSGASEVFVFDLSDGKLRHTLTLSDRPEGLTNYAANAPRLVVDASSDRLVWFVNDDPLRSGELIFSGNTTAAYVFDLQTGLEQLKISPPASSPYVSRSEFTGVTLVGDSFVAPTRTGTVLSYALGETLATPLAETSEILVAAPTIRLEFPARRGVSYQPEVSVDDGATWTPLGAKHYGNGAPATLRRSLADLPAPDSLRFRLTTAWESAPFGGGLIW